MEKETHIQQELFEFEKRKTIKGYPELRWTGKRPYKSTQYYPAQLKEVFGKPNKDGWLNKIFWGDNLQVMSHLLREYRGKIDLIYIDPPFDSKADFKLKVKIKGVGEIISDASLFEEKQYGDIWTNDEYLQFMYERLILIRELLSIDGSVFLHCDYRAAGYLRLIMDSIFGVDNFVNEIIWSYGAGGTPVYFFPRKHDNIYWYKKSEKTKFNKSGEIMRTPYDESTIKTHYKNKDESGRYYRIQKVNGREYKTYADEGKMITDVWGDIGAQNATSPISNEFTGYPTQKPEKLIERIIHATTNPNDLIFDCFMGSGTSQAVAMKMGRRFIGADINLGAIQTTSKRLNNILSESGSAIKKPVGFEIYNVNNYDFFRNPLEARDLLLEALSIQPFGQKKVFDGELDGRNVKIMPVNRIATKSDLKELISNLPYARYDKIKEENPNSIVDSITLVCMGHEPDLTAAFRQEVSAYRIDIEIVDILNDKKDLEFKREAQSKVTLNNGELRIESFYPMNLMQKLSLQKEHVENYKQLVESVIIDWDFDGEVLRPQVIDIPSKSEYVKGKYLIPEKHGRIKVKITDLLSESLEIEVE